MARRRRKSYSRLAKQEKKRYRRQTTIYTALTIFLIIAIIFWGIPSLIKVAVFLGDVRSSSQPISGEDKIPPPPPVLQPLPKATHSASIRIEGFAEEGSTVVLFLNGAQTQETVVESDGEFLFNRVGLNFGENEIYSKATDSSGNESKKSTLFIVDQDNEAPSLVVESPVDGESFFGFSKRNIRIKGSTEENTTLFINGAFVLTSRDGSFSYSYTLSEGENIISIIAKDQADNQTEEKLTVTFEN